MRQRVTHLGEVFRTLVEALHFPGTTLDAHIQLNDLIEHIQANPTNQTILKESYSQVLMLLTFYVLYEQATFKQEEIREYLN